MKKLFIILIALLFVLAGCGDSTILKQGIQGESGIDGINGTDGRDGIDGQNGQDGQDGLNSIILMSPKMPLPKCNGALGFVIASCLDVNVDFMCTETDTNQFFRILCDGTDGQNGEDGQSAVMPEFIDPCGDNGLYDEILLKFTDMTTGEVTIVAYLETGPGNSGKNKRLAILPCDNTWFTTTDGHSCVFRLNNSCDLRYPNFN